MSYTFYSGSPGLMRVKILPVITTADITSENRTYIREVKDKTREVIYNELLAFQKKV